MPSLFLSLFFSFSPFLSLSFILLLSISFSLTRYLALSCSLSALYFFSVFLSLLHSHTHIYVFVICRGDLIFNNTKRVRVLDVEYPPNRFGVIVYRISHLLSDGSYHSSQVSLSLFPLLRFFLNYT